ncbi:hypothetical protein JXC34_02155, partial [Candidatus Woesearchaeota archaeon]|nr:hypothetical protein [Candidatus Woesearchaeota archaeon]
NTRLPYFSITPTFSICPDHGYVTGEHFKCPNPTESEETCSKRCEVYSRIVGYYRPVDQWNAGKKEEFRQRLEFSEDLALKNTFMHKSELLQAEEERNPALGLPQVGAMISKYMVFSLPHCEKCASVKELLASSDIRGSDTSLKDDEGVREFRKYYKVLKDKLKRNSDGSLPIPTVLFFDSNENIIGTAHDTDQVRSLLGN